MNKEFINLIDILSELDVYDHFITPALNRKFYYYCLYIPKLSESEKEIVNSSISEVYPDFKRYYDYFDFSRFKDCDDSISTYRILFDLNYCATLYYDVHERFPKFFDRILLRQQILDRLVDVGYLNGDQIDYLVSETWRSLRIKRLCREQVDLVLIAWPEYDITVNNFGTWNIVRRVVQ